MLYLNFARIEFACIVATDVRVPLVPVIQPFPNGLTGCIRIPGRDNRSLMEVLVCGLLYLNPTDLFHPLLVSLAIVWHFLVTLNGYCSMRFQL